MKLWQKWWFWLIVLLMFGALLNYLYAVTVVNKLPKTP